MKSDTHLYTRERAV